MNGCSSVHNNTLKASMTEQGFLSFFSSKFTVIDLHTDKLNEIFKIQKKKPFIANMFVGKRLITFFSM